MPPSPDECRTCPQSRSRVSQSWACLCPPSPGWYHHGPDSGPGASRRHLLGLRATKRSCSGRSETLSLTMFLYWRKRGAYELESLPPSLTELEYGTVERFSWSSSLDIIEDLEDDRGLTEEKGLRCQNPDCIDKKRASKVTERLGPGAAPAWVMGPGAGEGWDFGSSHRVNAPRRPNLGESLQGRCNKVSLGPSQPPLRKGSFSGPGREVLGSGARRTSGLRGSP
ncbi:uncharacterized protein LOC116422856 [Sarcophilus harrisii]|uniref:uncharacterized protein LOC116422856 n=1 Tax=Sarcophilus harrisii TaxID=9305 RepID=UPI001301C60C|nr:uncharacterized protein LOC116422856 [Sarcophilus harrisii]